MKNRGIIAGTVLAASALCWALWGGTAKVDTIPAAAAESAVSAPCAPQMEQNKPINNIDITEPVTVFGSGGNSHPAPEKLNQY